jgi:hypothetical protein
MPPPRSIRPSVRPAAGGPASMTPASMRPPPASARDAYEDEDEDAEDEDGGRTIVRPEGAGKSARRSAPQSAAPPRSTPSANPTSISPAAVIRQTMESQRAATRGLASGPPPELRGDLDHRDNDEFTQTAAPRTGNRSGAHRSNYLPAVSYEGPPSHRPPQRGTERLDFANDDFRRDATASPGRGRFDSGDDYSSSRNQPPQSAPVSGPRSSPRSGPVSQPPPSSARPGHFANPAPSSYAAPPNGVNPHGPTHAMPAVGYGPMPNGSVPPPAQSNNAMSSNAMPAHFRMAQTGAVAGVMADPPGTSVTSNTRVSGRPAMSWAAALAACGVFVGVVAVAIAQRGDAMTDTQAALVDPAHTGKTTSTQPVETAPPANPLPPGLIGVSQPQTPPAVPAVPGTVPVVAPVNGMSDPNLGIAVPAPAAQPAPPPAAAAPTGEKVAKAPKASFAPARAAAASRPARPAAGDDDDDKPVKKTSKASKGDADEETRRALEELRKAQLEQSLGK